MANGINIANYPASGVYTIEIIGDTSFAINTIFGRLLIGSSRKGPANSVVNIREPRTSRSVYGGEDKFLENRGSYFHKSLNVMLNEGPVYALNILPVSLESDDTNPDKSWMTVFNTESATKNEAARQSAFKNFFNKQGFWFASDDELTKTKNNKYFGGQANKVLSFANLSKRQVSIFVRRADTTGYDITANEWYSSLGEQDIDVPTFVHGDDFISDYFVDVIVLEGDWTNYRRLSQDPVFYKYFNEGGLIETQINEFLSLNSVKLVTRQEGCLIPDFLDRNGRNVAIDRIMNNQYPLTEVLTAIDVSKLEDINLDPDTYEGFNDEEVSTHRVDIIGHGVEDLAETIDDHDNKIIDVISYRKPVSNVFVYDEVVDGNVGDIEVDSVTEANTFIKAYSDSKLYQAWAWGFINDDDLIVDADSASPALADVYANITLESDVKGEYIAIRGTSSAGGTPTDVIYANVGGTKQITFNTSQDNYSKDIDLSNFDSVSTTVNTIKLETTNTSASVIEDMLEIVKPGSKLKAKVDTNERDRVLRILSVSKSTEGTSGSPSYREWYTVTVMNSEFGIETVNNTKITAYYGIPSFVTDISAITLGEFKLRTGLLPNGTAARQQEIVDFLFDTNIAEAIVSSQAVNIRQIVDSYEGEIANSAKQGIVELGARHGKVMVFANNPSMKQFEESTDPSFIDSTTGLLSTSYIAQGGNLSLNPSFTFSLPEDTYNGKPIESFAYFCMPNLVIRDGGKNKSVPSAAYMSNVFMRKYKSGNLYGIAAGKRGKITEPEVVGVEYEFSDKDRGNLEPIGHNLIVRRRGIGLMAMTNNTAFQRVQSALNNAHVRDTLVTVEADLERILFEFLYDFNDEITRVRVQTLVENYLDNVVAARGVSSYSVQIDVNNNSNEVIQENSAIIDIRIDFPRGIHKFFNRITITKVGGEVEGSATGFVPR